MALLLIAPFLQKLSCTLSLIANGETKAMFQKFSIPFIQKFNPVTFVHGNEFNSSELREDGGKNRHEILQ
jgi:hypothetical protein